MELTLLNIVLICAFILLIISFFFSLFRFIKGPTISDRIVAMDLIASISMSFILVFSVLMKESMYFDIVIVISLISFISTVAISTYLIKKK